VKLSAFVFFPLGKREVVSTSLISFQFDLPSVLNRQRERYAIVYFSTNQFNDRSVLIISKERSGLANPELFAFRSTLEFCRLET